jgi:hypothetical protein
MKFLSLFAAVLLVAPLAASSDSGSASRVFHVLEEEQFCYCEFNTPPEDGPWGVTYIGAPCQRKMPVPGVVLPPWCWQEPEDNCGTIVSMDLYYTDGADCGPCEFKIEVEMSFPQPCDDAPWGCPYVCCEDEEWVNGAGESSTTHTVFDEVFYVACGVDETDICMEITCTDTILGVTGPAFSFGYGVGCSECY